MPGSRPASGGRFDPVTLSLLWNRLIGVVDEAAITLVRTSFSPVVQECNHYSCTLMDAPPGHRLRTGRELVAGCDGTPVGEPRKPS